MAISQYWVGQVPARPIAIDVRGTDGRAVNLSNYTDFKVVVVGSDNEQIDLTGSTLNSANASTGRFIFRWPKDRTVFEKTGEYLLQLQMSGNGYKDFTTEHNIKVRRLGGK